MSKHSGSNLDLKSREEKIKGFSFPQLHSQKGGMGTLK